MTDITDNFNRANETPLASPWTKISGGAGGLNLSANQVVPSGTNTDFDFYYSATWTADQASEAALTMTGGNASSGEGPGVILRGATGVHTDYRIVVNKAATNNVEVSRRVAGVWALLQLFTQAWTNGDVLRATVEGPSNNAVIKLYANGVQFGSVTDTAGTIPASGSPGLSMSGGLNVTGSAMDNWRGFDLTVVIPYIPHRMPLGV